MSCFEKVRDIINIGVTLLVGVCSVAVALFANNIAISANKTAELQAMIAKNAEAPTIQVVQHDCIDESQEDSFYNEIEISILNGKYNNLTVFPASFMVFSFSGYYYDDAYHWMPPNEVQVPMRDYYEKYSYSDVMYGVIGTWSNEMYAASANCLQKDCETYYEENLKESAHEPSLTTSVRTYLRITYLNLLNEEETLYYKIESGINKPIIKVSSGEGSGQFKNYFTIFNKQIFLRDGEAPASVFNKVDKARDLYEDMDD